MLFRASDVSDYYRPSKCELRVALRYRGEPEVATDAPFAKLLQELGLRHEKSHLATLSGVVNLSGLDQEQRERQTLDAIHLGAPALYQALFRSEVNLDGETCELVGEPDFLIRGTGRDGYIVRDSKLARNIFSDRHAAISMQLQIYGLLYERATGSRPLALEVHSGTDAIVSVPYEGEASVLKALSDQRRMRLVSLDTYEPVGWTKCSGCGFQARCWKEAKASQDVALLTAVNQKRAHALHDRGIVAISDIPVSIDDPKHREFFWQGKKKPRLRDFVRGLLRAAEAFLSEAALPIAPPALPDARNFAVLDLEGLPPYIDELEKTYLWGVKVFGDKPSCYLPTQIGFGPDGDREGWFAFLKLAERLFAEYGDDLPFVHWSPYERTALNDYIQRYGDVSSIARSPVGACLATAPSGTGAHVLGNLVDLLAVVKNSVVLPLPSYSLKVVDKYVGFRRKLEDANGVWSIAKYIEATETNDPLARDAIVGQILAYNQEDLDATWAVKEWVRKFASDRQNTVTIR